MGSTPSPKACAISHVTRVVAAIDILIGTRLDHFKVLSLQLYCKTWIVWRAYGFKVLLIASSCNHLTGKW